MTQIQTTIKSQWYTLPSSELIRHCQGDSDLPSPSPQLTAMWYPTSGVFNMPKAPPQHTLSGH